MRIALVSQRYPPETAGGGIATQTHAKAHGLAGLGHDVLVLSRSPDGHRHQQQDGPVQVTRIPSVDDRLPLHTIPAQWLAYSLELAAALAEAHARVPIDLVDFPEWGCEGYVHLINRAPWSSIPTVLQLHGPLVMFGHQIGWPELDSEFFRVGTSMEETCFRLADAVYSSSRLSAEWCVTHYGPRRDDIPVLHTGVDTTLFRPLPLPKATQPTILFVGALAANKGIDLLLDAALLLAEEFPGLRLRAVGRGEEAVEPRLRARASEAGRPELLELVGFLDRTALPGELNRAQLFAAPSEYEGGPGLVYLEAMACGLPVIACAGSGASEVVRHEETGLLVPPRDLEGLVAALRRLLADAALRARLGESARRSVAAEQDSRHCLERLAAFYQAVVQRCAEGT